MTNDRTTTETDPNRWDMNQETRRGVLTDFIADPQAMLATIREAATDSGDESVAADPYLLLIHTIAVELAALSIQYYQDAAARKLTGVVVGGLLFDEDDERETEGDDGGDEFDALLRNANERVREVRTAALAR